MEAATVSVSSTTVTVTLGDSEDPVELSTDAQGEFSTSSEPTSGSTLPQRSIVPPSAPPPTPPPSPPTSDGSREEVAAGQPSHPLSSSTTWEGQCVEGPSPRESPPSLPEVPLPNGPSGSISSNTTREGQMESRSSSPRERRKGPVQSPPPFPGVPLPAPSSSTSITSSATSITSNTDMQVH